MAFWNPVEVSVLPASSTECNLACLGGGFKYVFILHPYLGKIPILTNIFQMG